MKTLSKKIKIAVISLAIAVPVLAAIIVLANRKPDINKNDEIFVGIINAYTFGEISKASPIAVEVNSSIANAIDHKKQLPDNLFKIYPSVKGDAVWVDEQTIEFIPQEKWKSGQKYIVNFALDKLVDSLPKNAGNFVFDFSVIKQDVRLEIDKLQAVDEKNIKEQLLFGAVSLNDVIDSYDGIVSAKQDGKKLKVNIEKADDKKYFFTVEGIERKEKESFVEIVVNADIVGIDKDITKEIKVPAIGEFTLTAAKVSQDGKQTLTLQFSDPLKRNQDLNGLIQIGKYKKLNYIIDRNIIKIFLTKKFTGEHKIIVNQGIKNILGYSLKQDYNFVLNFDKMKPDIKPYDNGLILPVADNNAIFKFRVMGLKAVDVTVIRIYEKNILQFLQENDFEQTYGLARVGDTVFNDKIDLSDEGLTGFSSWNVYSLDLSKIIEVEPGAVYNITISGKKDYSTYDCDQETDDDYYWYSDNPCSEYYYSYKKISQNILTSNLGLIAKKRSDNSLIVFVSDIQNAEPLKGVKVEAFNYAQKKMAEAVTDKDGMVVFDKTEKPVAFLKASLDRQRGFMKLTNSDLLQEKSAFATDGIVLQNDIQGFIYGDRGVWRPGDSIYITFILKEGKNMLPQDYPITFKLLDPLDKVVDTKVVNKNSTGFYTFPTKTNENNITGTYQALVTVGDYVFSQPIKIETVRPNRIKIKYLFEDKYISSNKPTNFTLKCEWLTGLPAANLNADLTFTFYPQKTEFDKFKAYAFDDITKPVKNFRPITKEITLDADGQAYVSKLLEPGQDNARGVMQLSITTKVYEQLGGFSIDQTRKTFYPFDEYVGILQPKGDKNNLLITDTTHYVRAVIVDKKGNKIKSDRRLKTQLLKLDWNWWWDYTSDETDYVETYSSKVVSTKFITYKNGEALIPVKVEYPDWGEYILKVTDLESGHSSSVKLTFDWPGWAGHAKREGKAANFMQLKPDKKEYKPGDKAKITFSSSKGAKALVTIEKKDKIIKYEWIDADDENTVYEFEITKEMSPNVYVEVVLLQPHKQTANDLPLRIYGIEPVKVVDPETVLEPVLKINKNVTAESKLKITVSEKNNKPMTYTLAVVDEGLLSLTHFVTPNPWQYFFRKQALTMFTYDVFDYVIGASKEEAVNPILIGGDYFLEHSNNLKANRFKPVVKFIGPFTLKKGSRTHYIDLPEYIGEVRTMLVAGNGKAFGATEAHTKVTKPLMVLTSLPRTLGLNETVHLPVELFVQDNSIKNVTISVESKNITVVGQKNKTIQIGKDKNTIVDFILKTGTKERVAKITITAKSGNIVSKHNVEILVKNVSELITEADAKLVEKGQEWSIQYNHIGTSHNEEFIEISSIPPINLEERLNYLITYPHGCIEQTTSSGFPQLYVSDIVKINQKERAEIVKNIKATIKRIALFQTSDGGFSYWPSGYDADPWGTSYAGHFLIEAKNKGYSVSDEIMSKWLEYQVKEANKWTEYGYRSQYIQAYRLYTLALYGKPQLSAMNRLRNRSNLKADARWLLASAYYLAGYKNTATKLITGLSSNIADYTELAYTYGSSIRDKAIILMTYNLLNMYDKAYMLVKELSEDLSSKKWYSTQTTAYALVAISKYIKKTGKQKGIKCWFSVDGNETKLDTRKTIYTEKLISGNKLVFKNKSDIPLYVRLIRRGKPQPQPSDGKSNGLMITVNYRTLSGAAVDVENMKMGTDFVAEVIVTNTGIHSYRHLALAFNMPSGWENINARLFDSFVESDSYEYQDIRDDRVYTYFSLNRGDTKVFRFVMNSAFSGKFFLPATYVEAMYDATINAYTDSKWITVSKQITAK